MDPRLNLLTALMPLIDSFCEEQKDQGLSGFASYLQSYAEMPGKHRSEEDPTTDRSAIELMDTYDDQGASLAFHLNRLGKYAKYYVKEGFKGTELLNADDFGFLATVVERGEVSKSALIIYNVHEVPSGMEVIKRLLKKDLLQERVDREDRRVKMISATEKGRAVFFDAIQRMQPIARLVCGKLSEQEVRALNMLLSKLDHFHEHIYKTEKDYNIERILQVHL